uniref:G-protein coupled receptors family 3 profile domain-containing protein n=1 Tax=Pygocentrus nattereri TaxID=42514 RepID=A0AAR2JY74_PYGNA
MLSLSQQASDYDICIAYQAVIPTLKSDKVWIGTEDWSMATLVSGIPGISTIGTVLGVSVQYAPFSGFQDFENQAVSELRDISAVNSSSDMVVPCLQNTDLYTMATKRYSLENYDITSSFNVYKAVYAVAHALRQVLKCDSGQCEKTEVQAGQVPESRCSPECPYGYRQLQVGQHKCCFECMACPASTFLNKTGSTSCQSCAQGQWSPAESEACLNRTVLYLPWDAPLSLALLVLLALTLLLTLGTAALFLRNLTTPVVKSAGGRTCLLMLLSLTAASCSTLCHFGTPSQPACLLKQSLFLFSFTVCLACVTVRSFQV